MSNNSNLLSATVMLLASIFVLGGCSNSGSGGGVFDPNPPPPTTGGGGGEVSIGPWDVTPTGVGMVNRDRTTLGFDFTGTALAPGLYSVSWDADAGNATPSVLFTPEEESSIAVFPLNGRYRYTLTVREYATVAAKQAAVPGTQLREVVKTVEVNVGAASYSLSGYIRDDALGEAAPNSEVELHFQLSDEWIGDITDATVRDSWTQAFRVRTILPRENGRFLFPDVISTPTNYFIDLPAPTP